MLFSLGGENQPNIIEDKAGRQAFWSVVTCYSFGPRRLNAAVVGLGS